MPGLRFDVQKQTRRFSLANMLHRRASVPDQCSLATRIVHTAICSTNGSLRTRGSATGNTAHLELECLAQSVARRGAASHAGNEITGLSASEPHDLTSAQTNWVSADAGGGGSMTDVTVH